MFNRIKQLVRNHKENYVPPEFHFERKTSKELYELLWDIYIPRGRRMRQFEKALRSAQKREGVPWWERDHMSMMQKYPDLPDQVLVVACIISAVCVIAVIVEKLI